MFKRKWLPLWVSLIILITGGYYWYKSDEQVYLKGKYTISTITKTQFARNGIRAWSMFTYNNQVYYNDGIHPIPELSINDVGKRYFTIFLADNPSGHVIMTKFCIPDSIKSAPDTGWSEVWMKIHFPKVVEYVHDIRWGCADRDLLF